ncbi:3066_t:CDS:2, partial [Gigaspora rosea]
MSSSSAMPYDGIYEVTCDELYGEPYAEFYDEPYNEPLDEPHDELYNDNTTQEPTNTTGSDEFGDNESLTSIETNATNNFPVRLRVFAKTWP